MCEALWAKVFIPGQCTPLAIRSRHYLVKLANFCTYFRHLCIIEKRHPLLSFLLATVIDIALHTVSETLQGHHCDARPTDRPIDRYLQWLGACHFLPFDSAIFAKFFRTFWSIIPLGGVPGQKFCHQKFCLTMGNMFHKISRG